MALIYDWEISQFDVETAFLEGKLPEKEYQYMKIPVGMDKIPDKCFELIGGMYGLTQAARLFFMRFAKIMTTEPVNAKQCQADQCIFVKKEGDEICISLVHVDDVRNYGTRNMINKQIELIKTQLNITEENDHDTFLGCEIHRDTEDKTIYMFQKQIINRLIKSYEDTVETTKAPTTPGTPRKTFEKADKDDPNLLNDIEMTQYRSAVGSLMYLLKYSRPELSNCVRELAKGMQGANKTHQKELLRVIKWIMITKYRCLKLKPLQENGKLILKGICDASFAPELKTCRSVTGYIIYLNNAPIDWKSKKQSHVTLSSCESEYVAISEVIRGILEAKQIIECIGYLVEVPIKIYVDNIAAIYVARNNTGKLKTRHINVRYHFVRELVNKGEVEIIFIRSEKNRSDIMTKNCDREIFGSHEGTLIVELPKKFITKTTN